MILVQKLQKHFGAVKAVDGVSFEIADGCITGLLGPNGSGKTTTLRMLYALLQPDSGKVLVDGMDAWSQSLPAKAAMGVVPDARGLYPRLTARENIAYFGELQGISGKALARRIDALAQELEMQDFLERPCKGFSQGQRAKVAIARAFVGNPQNLLLDEPGNGLDVMSNRALRRYLLRQKEQGKAILLSTHIMQEVTALCDEVVVIAAGVIKAVGTPEALMRQAGKDNIEDAFVALIGSDEGIMA
ncbi:MAG TPA: ATP-binding cassette domain-containing protein [Thiolapillus brandeum]|uniref:ATP-binding cassette domain-containing protein n=1 Tax=Thiolapillus brandeum TaxID=1076588 RepID=A0A831RZG9_9GAMM|nr:ATP-binding cassette domain-containing protein [Thiolapillus brandeum]